MSVLTAPPTIAIQLVARQQWNRCRRRRSLPNAGASAPIGFSFSGTKFLRGPAPGRPSRVRHRFRGGTTARARRCSRAIRRGQPVSMNRALGAVARRLRQARTCPDAEVGTPGGPKPPGTTQTRSRYRARTMTSPRVGARASSDRGVARVAQWQSSALVMRRSWVRIPPRAQNKPIYLHATGPGPKHDRSALVHRPARRVSPPNAPVWPPRRSGAVLDELWFLG